MTAFVDSASDSDEKHGSSTEEIIYLRGSDLSIDEVVRVARYGARVVIPDDPEIRRRVDRSCEYIRQAVRENRKVYGVTSGFGGMADVMISPEEAIDLQNNAMWYHKTGAGRYLPIPEIRAAMLLRANSHLRGVSGIRFEIIQRIVTFLNARVTPRVREFGSIGASGDLVPLVAITGALVGTDSCFTVDFDGEQIDCLTALKRLNLPRLQLKPKEGLAMMNGTAFMTGIAANCMHDARILLALTLQIHALIIQALRGTNQSFHPFIHQHKPHPGQVWTAAHMLELLNNSQLSRDELKGMQEDRDEGELLQDRYSLRCIPQFLGPIVEGMSHIVTQLSTEINSANDNPLIDADSNLSFHGGNFLGQYVSVGMDHLRYYIGLLAKHIDVQIALLVAPEFNNGLPPSLVGNPGRKVNMGLKGLQLTGNSIMPLLTFLGNSLADRFPTHAEQFNQNINSQGFGSANLTRQSIETFQQYIAVALIFAVQAVDLRTYQLYGHYNASEVLSPKTRPLYEAMRRVVGRRPGRDRPYIWNDDEQPLEMHISRIVADIASDGVITQAVNETVESLKAIIVTH